MIWMSYGVAFVGGLAAGIGLGWKWVVRLDDRERDALFAEGFTYGMRHAHNHALPHHLDADENEWEWGVGA